MTSQDLRPWFAKTFDRAESAQEQTKAAARILDWHHWLTRKGESSGPRKALRAQLKRCRAPGDAVMLPGFIRIFEDIYPSANTAICDAALQDEKIVAGLARVAIVAAALDDETVQNGKEQGLARQMLGPSAHIDRDTRKLADADVSELRARALLKTTDPDTAMQRWQRTLPIFAHNRVNLPQLAQAVFHWDDDTRRRLSFAYFTLAARGPDEKTSGEDKSAA
jgi:CRISPR type I-E-associated protein CasB/Cse2